MINFIKKDKLKLKLKINKNFVIFFIINLILLGIYNFLILIRNMEKIMWLMFMYEVIVYK